MVTVVTFVFAILATLAICLISFFNRWIYLQSFISKLVEIYNWRATFRVYASVVLLVSIICASTFHLPDAYDKKQETRKLSMQNRVQPTNKECKRSWVKAGQ